MRRVRAQAVGRDAVTPDNHSGFWHQRYTLRSADDGSASGNKEGRPGAGRTVQHTPVFLESLKGTILTSGAAVLKSKFLTFCGYMNAMVVH